MDFALPPVGEGLIEVELVRWLVKPGDRVERGQPLMEVLSDKATMEVPSAFAGRITETLADEGGKIKVGELAMRYTDDAEATPVVPSSIVPSGAKPMVVRGELSGLLGAAPVNGVKAVLPSAAPSVRLLARKLGVELAALRGSGPGGRILHDDLVPFLRSTNAAPEKKPEPAKVDYGAPGTRSKLTGLRRKIAEHMVEAKRTIPHYTYIDECDVTDLVRIRGQLKERFARLGVKLTYLPFVIKAVARALKQIPIVNSTFDEATQELQLHATYNIGVAVAAPNGLIVPVVKDALKLDVAAIAVEIERLSADARSGKSKLDDLKGGSFTVTSVGNIGGLISTPIINSPEVGILGLGKVVKRPVYDAAGQIRPADLLYLSCSFDHRILDGAIGAAFGNAVIAQLQNPAALLLPERFAG